MTGLFRKIGQALLASLLFLVVLALVYLAHARFFSVEVVFYAALLDVVLALLISAGVLVLARALSVFEKVQMLLIWASCNIVALPSAWTKCFSHCSTRDCCEMHSHRHPESANCENGTAMSSSSVP